MLKLSKLFLVLIIASLSINSFAHSGRTDANGGHNCSEASKKKGLCTGYHYHKRPRTNYTSIDIEPEEENQKAKHKVEETSKIS